MNLNTSFFCLIKPLIAPNFLENDSLPSSPTFSYKHLPLPCYPLFSRHTRLFSLPLKFHAFSSSFAHGNPYLECSYSSSLPYWFLFILQFSGHISYFCSPVPKILHTKLHNCTNYFTLELFIFLFLFFACKLIVGTFLVCFPCPVSLIKHVSGHNLCSVNVY